MRDLFTATVAGDAAITIRCLEHLLQRGHAVRGVITADARVAAWSAERGLRILFQPPRVRLEAEAVRELTGGEAFDFFFSIHNLRVLSPEVLSLPRVMAINYHDALLPHYAGLHATTWAIARGEKRHGITWHRMTPGIDEGEILVQREFPIDPRDTAWTLGGRCLEAACDAFHELVSSKLTLRPQPAGAGSSFRAWQTPAPGCVLPANASAAEIRDLVRALQFTPADNPIGLPSILTGHGLVSVEEVAVLDRRGTATPGTVLRVDGATIEVSTRTDDVRLTLSSAPLLEEGDALERVADTPELRRSQQRAKRHEAWWIERLADLRPLAIPSLLGPARTSPISMTRGIRFDDPVGAFLRYLRTAINEPFDIGFSREPVEPAWLFESAPPLRVDHPYDATDRFTFPRDLPRRIRRLRSVAMPPMRLSISDAELPVAEGAVLDAVLSRDGSRLTLRSTTATDDALAAFFDGLRDVALAPRTDGPTVLTMFDAHVLRDPHAAAIEDRGRRISYEKLSLRMARLAAALIRRGARRETIVAIRADDTFDLVTAMFGVMRAGAAFLVIDPLEPPPRIARILAAAKPLLAIGDGHPIALADAEEFPPVVLPGIGSADLAYVAFTSGSTGPPKGAAIEHRSLAYFIETCGSFYGFGPHDRVLQIGSPAFDLAYEQIFGALCHGATLVASDRPRYEGPRELLEECERKRVSVLDVPTAVFEQLARSEPRLPESLRITIVGGDEAKRDDFARWLRASGGRSRLVNTYGPTETTIVATWWEARGDLPEKVPIGTAVDGVELLIEDGELWIGGPQVARGYHLRPELTAQRFVAIDGCRFYRTGDRVATLPDGTLGFLGRTDRQIKVGARRVEPEEIEAVLRGFDGVAEAAVLPVRAVDGNVALHAFVVPRERAQITTTRLRELVVEHLPPAMRPSRIDLCNSLPRAGSGKIDFGSLQDAPPSCAGDAPRDDTERKLVALWDRIIGSGAASRTDDFFELGGDSLSAVLLLEAIERELDVRLPLRTMLHRATIASLAAAIHLRTGHVESSVVPLQPHGDRPPLFCVHGLGGHVLRLLPLARALDPEQPLFGLQSPGLDDSRPIPQTVQELAAIFLAEIDGRGFEDPLHLAGMSFGGFVALEMARLAVASGRRVAFVGMFDTFLSRQVAEPRARLRRAFGDVLGRTRRHARRLFGGRDVAARPNEYRHFTRVLRANDAALGAYKLAPYEGPVTFFAATPRDPDIYRAFRERTSCQLEIVPVTGDHLSMLEPPHVAGLAEALLTRISHRGWLEPPGVPVERWA